MRVHMTAVSVPAILMTLSLAYVHCTSSAPTSSTEEPLGGNASALLGPGATPLKRFNVADYGATPNSPSAAASNTAYIQNAIDDAWTQVTSLADTPVIGDNPDDTMPSVYFPSGVWYINGSLTLRVNVTSDSHAIIKQTATTIIFDVSDGLLPPDGGVKTANYMRHLDIQGLTFDGGTNQILFNISSAGTMGVRWTVDQCSFRNASAAAIQAQASQQGTPGSTPTDANGSLIVTRCDFSVSNTAIQAWIDRTLVRDTWVAVWSGFPDDTAVFQNMTGELRLEAVNMTPNTFDQTKLKRRWIDNYGAGNVTVHNSAFGGDSGGGMPVVYHFAAPGGGYGSSAINPYIGSSIVIKDSDLFAGNQYIDPADPSHGYNPTDPSNRRGVVVLVNSIPHLIDIQGDTGVNATPYIRALPAGTSVQMATGVAATAVDPNTWLSNFRQTVNNSLVDLHDVFKFRLDENAEYGARAPDSMPWPLLTYVYPRRPLFPEGTREAPIYQTADGGVLFGQANNTPWSTPGQAVVSTTIPGGLRAFSAMVTMSADPNPASTAAYRASSTYVVSYGTGNGTGGLTDYLTYSATPIATQSLNSAVGPTLVSVTFDNGMGQYTANSSRTHAEPPAPFTMFITFGTQAGYMDAAEVTIVPLNVSML